MYFYIVEALRNKNVNKALPRLKDELSKKGIAGEIVTTNPLRPAKELLELGLRKGYSTIVAVGDDAHINEIVGLILGLPVALGVIPVNASEALCRLIGVFNLDQALSALRFRKLREISLASIQEKNVFLTHAVLKNRLPTLFTVIFEDFILYVRSSELLVANLNPFSGECLPGKITLFAKEELPSTGFLSKLLGSKPKEKFTTKITTPVFKIETKDPFPILIGETRVTNTPATFKALSQTIRLVVAKEAPSFRKF